MTVMDWFAEVLGAAGDVWSLRVPAALELGAQAMVPVAAGVAVLAGLATMLGHSVVFAINRVTGLRMAAGMTLGALYLAVLRAFTAVVIGLLALVVTRGAVDGVLLAVVYLLAMAPHLLGVLVFIPHFGLVIGRLLEVWTLVSLAALLVGVLGIGRVPAAAIALAAWLVSQLLSHLLAKPLALVSSRVWTLATGHETFITTQDILAGAPFVPLERQERPT
ncbi:MAG TPA: hypothetical protein H9815_06600 [Candidatus Ruania gallistercoris]|uniref:Yip1 domain-containing protein n=1 Tax=Candidatus Ruania gallistercoris TaxID=2838746 RepID=A0A9D2ED15_9MICO|nr:hypothetical protein [Candidatus Ruania gallistercoris]